MLALPARIGSDPAPPPGRGNPYLPVDAALIPPLLDDEARALGSDRGLVFLPGGRVLGFDPARSGSSSSLLFAERRETSDG